MRIFAILILGIFVLSWGPLLLYVLLDFSHLFLICFVFYIFLFKNCELQRILYFLALLIVIYISTGVILFHISNMNIIMYDMIMITIIIIIVTTVFFVINLPIIILIALSIDDIILIVIIIMMLIFIFIMITIIILSLILIIIMTLFIVTHFCFINDL